jgi:hypothetical protein
MAFTVCWTPYAFLSTVDFAGRAPDPVYVFFVLLAHGNSTANVFLYGLTNQQFREGYARFLRLDRLCPSLKVTHDYDHSATVKVTPTSKTITVQPVTAHDNSVSNNNKDSI